MVTTLKNSLRELLPKKYQPGILLANWLSARSNGLVMSGPFKGMKYVPGVQGGSYFPKIVGSYEMELNQIVYALIANNFQTIINVGAGEGYYAVGFCLQCPHSQVFAFEATEKGQKLIAEMALKNQVEKQIVVKGFCKPTELQRALRGAKSPSLVIMDIEGGEEHLLNPEIIPELASSHILVELHDVFCENISKTIANRFAQTHEIIEVWSRERTVTDFPEPLSFISKIAFRKYILYFMDEGRPGKMNWYYLKPLSVNQT
ncbi:hypothetical protein [Synechocystis sp. PCC 7509]|uniref:hypothetical protein n=1 Tax=Synechocystis sp. PCC 7509 TaxID=927677 RepID=UPI0002ACC11F|nr:hypothetical protein [Synechocystis sp. PCC 7509]